jgi:Ca2+-binding EF-hand superfamily protein
MPSGGGRPGDKKGGGKAKKIDVGMAQKVAATKKDPLYFEEGSPTQNIIRSLNLKRSDMRKLKRKFDNIDLDNSGAIDMEEFFSIFNEKATPYSKALFELSDIDGNGTIEFDEFIQILCSYCVYSKDDILRFCFDTFDKDGSGEIDENEYITFMQGLANADPLFPGNFSKALNEFDVNDDGIIDYTEFRQMCQKFPSLYFPAFRLQDRMQGATLGKKRWHQVNAQVFKDRQVLEYFHSHNKFPSIGCFQSIAISMKIVDHPYQELMRKQAEQQEALEVARAAASEAYQNKLNPKAAKKTAKEEGNDSRYRANRKTSNSGKRKKSVSKTGPGKGSDLSEKRVTNLKKKTSQKKMERQQSKKKVVPG